MNGFFRKQEDLCSELISRLDDFLDGNLNETELFSMESHRLGCPKCQKALRDEERVRSLLGDTPSAYVPPGFRDNVLRAWRLKRDRVKDSYPVEFLSRVQLGIGIIILALLILPTVRMSIMASASRLSGALDRLPDEYREGIPVTITLPTWTEIIAQLQVWQGRVLELLADFGTSIAPWSTSLWMIAAFALILCVGNFFWLRTRLRLKQDSGRSKS